MLSEKVRIFDKQVTEIRVSEIRVSEIRVSKISVTKIRVTKIRVTKIRVSKIRISSNHCEVHGAIFVAVKESHYNYISSVLLQINHRKFLEIAFLNFEKLLVLDIARYCFC